MPVRTESGGLCHGSGPAASRPRIVPDRTVRLSVRVFAGKLEPSARNAKVAKEEQRSQRAFLSHRDFLCVLLFSFATFASKGTCGNATVAAPAATSHAVGPVPSSPFASS